MNEKEDLTPKTRRETLMCQRAAQLAANTVFQHLSVSVWDRPPWPGTLGIAKKLFPLKKTVMREVIASGLRYRLNDGKLEYYDMGWQPSTRVAEKCFKAVSDLYANPTEEVDDDGTN